MDSDVTIEKIVIRGAKFYPRTAHIYLDGLKTIKKLSCKDYLFLIMKHFIVIRTSEDKSAWFSSVKALSRDRQTAKGRVLSYCIEQMYINMRVPHTLAGFFVRTLSSNHFRTLLPDLSPNMTRVNLFAYPTFLYPDGAWFYAILLVTQHCKG
uniref:Cullin domain-containing protein n=1 Tax=Heterorhabditis bacteriophora TaxID=37862 RepID=A0A1I7WU53_HETBA